MNSYEWMLEIEAEREYYPNPLFWFRILRSESDVGSYANPMKAAQETSQSSSHARLAPACHKLRAVWYKQNPFQPCPPHCIQALPFIRHIISRSYRFSTLHPSSSQLVPVFGSSTLDASGCGRSSNHNPRKYRNSSRIGNSSRALLDCLPHRTHYYQSVGSRGKQRGEQGRKWREEGGFGSKNGKVGNSSPCR